MRLRNPNHRGLSGSLVDGVAVTVDGRTRSHEELNDLHVPWGPILSTLHENGWSGWLSSEYEGRREPYRGREMVRRQHALLRRIEAGL